MLNGFFGRPAAAYLTRVSIAHTAATSSTTQASAQSITDTGTQRTPPRMLPFSPEDARMGNFATGRGSSRNIVAGRGNYEEIARKIIQADDKAGECLYRIAMEVENMCNTIFMLPEASPRCLNVAATTKTFLDEYRSLTDEIAANVRNFAKEITEIG